MAATGQARFWTSGTENITYLASYWHDTNTDPLAPGWRDMMTSGGL